MNRFSMTALYDGSCTDVLMYFRSLEYRRVKYDVLHCMVRYIAIMIGKQHTIVVSRPIMSILEEFGS